MAPKRARTKANAEAQPQPVDRISKLPDPIIHRILSLVPTIDVVRMCLLSKRWRRVWCSVPALNFSDSDRTKYFPSRRIVGFYTFFNNCLKHRKAASHYVSDSVVARFHLSVECPRGTAAMEKFLAFAVQSNAEEIDLRVRNGMNYSLPDSVLNMRSLSVLKLDRLVLDGSYPEISLPVLKHLSLIVEEVCYELLIDLISGCPSLENFFLQYWDQNFKEKPPISITSSTLKFLEVKTGNIEEVHVDAENLVSFKYEGSCKSLDIYACTAIRNLSLLTKWIDNDQAFEDLIFGLPVLENLTLGKFNVLKYNRIRGQNLKSIRLVEPYSSTYGYHDVYKVTIEAPNLTSFRYRGYKELNLSLNSPHDVSSCN